MSCSKTLTLFEESCTCGAFTYVWIPCADGGSPYILRVTTTCPDPGDTFLYYVDAAGSWFVPGGVGPIQDCRLFGGINKDVVVTIGVQVNFFPVKCVVEKQVTIPHITLNNTYTADCGSEGLVVLTFNSTGMGYWYGVTPSGTAILLSQISAENPFQHGTDLWISLNGPFGYFNQTQAYVHKTGCAGNPAGTWTFLNPLPWGGFTIVVT